jgi:putative Flp pilus-assembly TadE/G-like protein
MRMVAKASSGQIAVIAALMIVGLLACAALATDLGYFQNTRRRMQSAADSAAIAGEREIIAGQTDTVVSAAQNDAALNGFTDGAGTVQVAVNNPPTSGPNAGSSKAVEVIVSETQPTYFLKVIGIPTVTVSARAAAIPGNSFNCIHALDPTADNTVTLTGVSLFYTNCTILDNSNSDTALSFNIVTLAGARSWDVVGDVGSFLITLVAPKPITHVPPENDPLAYLPEPSVGACDHTNYHLPLVGFATLNPGVYCGGITGPILGVSAAIITLNPGVYIMRGGGLWITGAAVIQNVKTGGDGSGGVMFYLTGDSTYPYSGVNLTGAAINLLNAPTSGTYEGILFFQDRNIDSATAAAHPNTVIGAALAKYEGALYFSTTELFYTGANLAAYTIIVADKIHFILANVTDIYSDYSSLPDGSPIKTAVLAE